MTYCDNEWISDYTYEDIWSEMYGEAVFGTMGAPNLAIRADEAQEYLVVLGSIYTATDQVQLDAFYRVPNGEDMLGRVPGGYSIRLLDVNDDRLVDYPFTPKVTHLEPGSNFQAGEAVTMPAMIAEEVPWVTDTIRIAILRSGAEIASRAVSANPPQVAILYPNGGETLGKTPFTLSWRASDADGDPLTFTVGYS